MKAWRIIKNIGIAYLRKCDVAFFIIAFLLLVLRQALVSKIPLYVLAPAPHDDSWVVWRAKDIYEGQWLGEYN